MHEQVWIVYVIPKDEKLKVGSVIFRTEEDAKEYIDWFNKEELFSKLYTLSYEQNTIFGNLYDWKATNGIE